MMLIQQIRAVFQDSALGFTLVDSSLERTIEPDQMTINSTSQVTMMLVLQWFSPQWSSYD